MHAPRSTRRAIAGILLFAFVGPLRAVRADAATPASSPDPWFRVTVVADGVWRIDDRGKVNAYLIEGDESALLVDTTTGQGNLARCVSALTRRPLQVVVTHGHGDHAGGIGQFEKAYVHPADLRSARACLPWRGWLASRTQLVPVRHGERLDLGHRPIEVIHVPGHTPGSIVLLDMTHRLLFTGDNNNGMVWLFLRESTPLEVYLQTLRGLNQRSAEFDTMLPGHGTPLPASFIVDQMVCIEHILDGTAQVEGYRWYGGTTSLAKYGRAMVAFDPRHLRADR